jgi:hypothetical protein
MSEYSEETELVDELFLEQTKEEGGSHTQPVWHRQVAISTLFLALFAAVGALMAGISSHEIILQRTEELIELSISQTDRVNIEVIKVKHELLRALEQPLDPAEVGRLETWEQETSRLDRDEQTLEIDTRFLTSVHLVFAISSTVLAFAITISGMSVIVDHKSLWYAGMVLGVMGILGVIAGIFIRSLN